MSDTHAEQPHKPLRTIDDLLTGEQRAKLNALGQDANITAIIPRTVEEAYRLAVIYVAAGLAPSSYNFTKDEVRQDRAKDGKRDPAKVMLGIMKGLEIGVGPLTAINNIAIINNRPSVWGDLAVALMLRDGKLARNEVSWSGGERVYNENEISPKDFTDDFTCIVKLWRRGTEEPFIGQFSVRDAKRAGLWMNPDKDPWIKYPKRMLFNRARAFPLRDGFADGLAGLSIREEMEDIEHAPAPARIDTSFLADRPQIERPREEALPDPGLKPEAAKEPAVLIPPNIATDPKGYAKWLAQQIASQADKPTRRSLAQVYLREITKLREEGLAQEIDLALDAP